MLPSIAPRSGSCVFEQYLIPFYVCNALKVIVSFTTAKPGYLIVALLCYFGMFEESPQLSTSGSARLLVTIQSNKLLLLAAM